MTKQIPFFKHFQNAQKDVRQKQLLRKLRLLGLGLCGAILFTSFFLAQTKKQPDFSAYIDLLFQEQLASDTLSLHYTLADPASYGIKSYEVTLGSYDADDALLTRISCENMRAALNQFDTKQLSTADRLTYDILNYTIDQTLAGCAYADYEEPLNAISGIQAELPVLLAEYTFRSQTDVEDYLALIQSTPAYFSQLIAFEEKKSDSGLFMPTFAADAISEQIAALLTEPAFSCLTETFAQKLSALTDLTDIEKQQYIREHARLITGCLVPAYTSLQECLTQLRGTAAHDGGLCQLPDGASYYAYLVQRSTASTRSIDELSQMIARARDENLTALAKLLSSDAKLPEKMAAVQLAWQTPEQMLTHLKTRMCTDFPAAPDNSYKVKTVAPAMQEFLSPAFYLTAPMDDPNENNIYINPAYEHSKLELFTTLAHEGYPGHLYETVSSYAQDFSPLRHILGFGGYTEGWATYVEMYAYDYAGLEPNTARALQLNAAATLSLYASIDIGIHHEGWDRDTVLEFLSDFGISSVDTAAHVYELVVETPANYLKYYIGYLEFLELKKDAMLQYGTDYSDKAFHQALLAIGPAPFSIIKQYLPLYYHASASSNA